MSDVGDDGDGVEVFGPYRLETLLGRGGMGEVWRAFDTRRERPVALKRLSAGWADDDEFRERFRLEARMTARLGSAHVIPIHDFGEIDGRLFIDMRLIPGGDLAHLIAAHPRGLGAARAVDVVEQVAGALEAAHRDGLVHRDVKPSNVLVESDGVREAAYLVDFGIAKLALQITGAKNLTMTGTTLGTPAYMAPELFDGASGATVASDVYALGCVLYEALTGRRPFSGTHAMVLMNQHLHVTPPAPSALDPALAPFDPVIARALAKDPAHRPASVAEMRAEMLRAGAAAPSDRRSPPTGPPPSAVATWSGPGTGSGPGDDGPATVDLGTRRPPWWRRRATAIVAVALVAVLVAGGAVVTAVVATRGGDVPAGAPAAPPAPALAGPERVPVALSSPGGRAFSPDGRRAYVANADAGTVVVLDTATRAVVATVPIGPRGLNELAVSPDGRRLYVPRSGVDAAPGSSLAVVDTATNAVVAEVPVPPLPTGVAVSPDGRRVYVASQGTAAAPGTAVTTVDALADTAVGTARVGDVPTRLAVSPDGRRVYVTTFGAGTGLGGLAVLDTLTGTVAPGPGVAAGPNDVAVSPDGRRLYVSVVGTDGDPGGLQVVDPASGNATDVGVPGVRTPLDVALSPDGRTLLVSFYGDEQTPEHVVAVVDTTTLTVRRQVSFAGRVGGATVTPDGREAWVTTNQPDELWRIPLP